MTENREHLAARIGKAILRWAALAAGLVLSVRAASWGGSGQSCPTSPPGMCTCPAVARVNRD